MSRTVPSTEPDVLVAGDSWSWTKTIADYPPSEGWTLGYSIRGPSTLNDSDVATSTSGTGYAVAVDKTKTAALAAGTYQWASYVDKASSGEHYTVETGVFTVLRNLSAVVGADAQSHAERTLAKIESEIELRLTGKGDSHESYSVGGRAISKIPMAQLLRFRAIYQSKVFRERNPGQLGPTVLAQMNNPDGTIGTSEPVVLPVWFRSLTS